MLRAAVLVAAVYLLAGQAKLRDLPSFLYTAAPRYDAAAWNHGGERFPNDFGNTQRYGAENAAVRPPAGGEQRVVFMGDSITDNLHNTQRFGPFFPGKPYLNRGISGQVTGQMLLRFYQDVIALQPKAVVIFGGTNDIGGNIGPVPLESTENNLGHGIRHSIVVHHLNAEWVPQERLILPRLKA